MIKNKLINFFDKHRLILILFTLAFIIIIFFLIKLISFKNYEFKALKCEEKVNSEICFNNNKEVYLNPLTTKEAIFKEYKDYITDLKKEYNLPEFNYYTAYYYKEISNLDYSINKRNLTLNTFFNRYVNTYNLANFYQKNTIFYELFYPYKIV